MSLIRTFIAVEMSPEVRSRAAALIERLRVSQVKATWTRPENMHLTLKFLGDTPDTRIPDVCKAVAAGASRCGSFTLKMYGAGAFPRIESPRTVWMGASDGQESMAALQAAIDAELFERGFARERRRYVPHLTLGRVRSGGPAQTELGKLLQEHAAYEGGVTLVDEVVVFASELEKSGPTYHVLGHAELTGDE